eukprot:3494207-Pyramimonas_sp.AAC.1
MPCSTAGVVMLSEAGGPESILRITIGRDASGRRRCSATPALPEGQLALGFTSCDSNDMCFGVEWRATTCRWCDVVNRGTG